MLSYITRLSFFQKLILSFGLSITALSGFYYLKQNAITIYTFDEKRDTNFILDIFKHDWDWLVSEYSTDFSAEYMLKNKASSKNPQHLGNLTIKVLYQGTEPTGFVAYYKKKFYEGYILFLAINRNFRSKGYGLTLLKHAMNELVKQGCTKIELVTRVSNKPARALYTRAGFKEKKQYDGFVYFEYFT